MEKITTIVGKCTTFRVPGPGSPQQPRYRHANSADVPGSDMKAANPEPERVIQRTFMEVITRLVGFRYALVTKKAA